MLRGCVWMTASKDERNTRSDYAERYRIRASATIVDEAEREVIGEVWGANGFTYLAQRTGCEVVVTDLPTEGLEVASRRAKVEGLRSLGAVAASARRFPFAENSFDAIVHVDLIC
jgi:cyclopropane fatty-acyl-phospholipid synthase-like methyltransferase